MIYSLGPFHFLRGRTMCEFSCGRLHLTLPYRSWPEVWWDYA